jgi:hypothetical protein
MSFITTTYYKHAHNLIITTSTNKTSGVQQTHSPKNGVRNQFSETISINSPPKCISSCVFKFIMKYYVKKNLGMFNHHHK